MTISYIELATTGVQHLQPYLPGKPVDELERELGISNSIKLASNENPFGPSPLAIEAMQRNLDGINFYPDGGGYQLSRKIAELHGIDPSSVTLGNGSNDVLELVTRAYLTPSHSAVFSEYSFAVYPIVVQAVGARAKIARALPEDDTVMPLGHDAEAMLAAIDDDTRMVFIANPNNPTGTWMDKDTIHGLISSIRDDIIVVLDLAYHEYMDDDERIDTAQWLSDFPNLLITCTFSKIHALAGLRIGYGLSGPQIADVLNRVRQPFNTNLLAQAAALAALEDEDYVKRSAELNREGMHYIQQQLDAASLRYLPSRGNFITIHFEREAMPLYEALLQRGVIVRPVANYGLPEYLRVSIGTQEQNVRFIDTLNEIL